MTSHDLIDAHMIAAAHIQTEAGTGEWICACGNTSGQAGFHACHPDGTHTAPLPSSWAGHYICTDCDAVMASDGLIIRTGSTD